MNEQAFRLFALGLTRTQTMQQMGITEKEVMQFGREWSAKTFYEQANIFQSVTGKTHPANYITWNGQGRIISIHYEIINMPLPHHFPEETDAEFEKELSYPSWGYYTHPSQYSKKWSVNW